MGERRLPGEHEEEDATERVDIGARVERTLAAALLGRHIGGRADDVPGAGDPGLAVHELADAEVEQLGALAARHRGVGDQEDVLRLEVAVQDVTGVRGAERRRQLPRQVQRLIDRHGAGARDALIEALTFEVLHHQVGAAIDVIAEVEDLDDARILDRRRGLGLVEKTLERLRPRRGGGAREQLDGDAATQHAVLGEVHHAHAALSEDALELVTADVLEHDRFRCIGRAGAPRHTRSTLARHLLLVRT